MSSESPNYFRSIFLLLFVCSGYFIFTTKRMAKPQEWKVDDVCNWLKQCNLAEDYTALFQKAKIDGEVLLTLSTQDLNGLGVVFGDARKLELRIQELRSGKYKVGKEEERDGSDDEKEEAPLKKAVIRGYLEFKGLWLRTWTKKWFVCENNELRYYNDDTDVTPKEIIPLIGVEIFKEVERDDRPAREYFALRTENRDWLLRAFTEKDKNEWVAALESQIVKKEVPKVASAPALLRTQSFLAIKK